MLKIGLDLHNEFSYYTELFYVTNITMVSRSILPITEYRPYRYTTDTSTEFSLLATDRHLKGLSSCNMQMAAPF